MPPQNFGYRELLQLVELIESSTHFREFRFRSGDLEIELRRGDGAQSPRLNGATPPLVASSAAAPDPSAAAAPAGVPTRSSTAAPCTPSAAPPTPRGGAQFGVASPKAGAATASPEPLDGVVIRSPMVGTFYRAPEPGAAPFVEVGQPVEAETTVCIIEVMKLMNSLLAGSRGTVAQILVADGEAVEYGQPLIVVRPA